MVDVVHARLMAVEEALRSILGAENRGKDRKTAEAVATLILDENKSYSEAAGIVAERADPRRSFYEGAGEPDPKSEDAPAEAPAEEPAEKAEDDEADADKSEDEPKAKAPRKRAVART
jgi:hypothetical protein